MKWHQSDSNEDRPVFRLTWPLSEPENYGGAGQTDNEIENLSARNIGQEKGEAPTRSKCAASILFCLIDAGILGATNGAVAAVRRLSGIPLKVSGSRRS